MMKRSQYKGMQTGWSEMIHHDIPRFGLDKVVRLHALGTSAQEKALRKGKGIKVVGEPFKISFSFDKDRFLVPWVAVSNGKAAVLTTLKITFVYAGDHILKVQSNPQFIDVLEEGEAPEHFEVQYRWEEYSEVDTMMGLTVYLGLGSLVLWVLISFSFADRRTHFQGE